MNGKGTLLSLPVLVLGILTCLLFGNSLAVQLSHGGIAQVRQHVTPLNSTTNPPSGSAPGGGNISAFQSLNSTGGYSPCEPPTCTPAPPPGWGPPPAA